MKKLIALGLGSALALAACGGASAPAPATGSPARGQAAATAAPGAQTAAPAAKATVAPAAAGPARKVSITATNSLYSIKTLEVRPGERIEFVLTNEGDEKHNIVAIGEGLSILSPDFDAGQTLSWTWTAPAKLMEFKFICAYHSEVPPILVTVR